MAMLKPVLVVVMISLSGICATSLFNHDAGPLTFSLQVRLERLTDECLESNPSWERDVCERIARGDTWIGMTEEMIIASRGEPRSSERPLGEDSTREDWTYQTARFGLVVLEFEDGILTSWGLVNPDCPACQVKQARE